MAVLALVMAGPRERFRADWTEPDIGPDVDAFLREREAEVSNLRPGDQKGVEWADPESRSRTAYSIVYLHGFSADRHEVEPLITDLGKELGANVYFARLRGHGRDDAAMAEGTTAAWAADAAEALAVGSRIGERIVLVGTSTGGTLALWAAAQDGAGDRLAALVLISPNLGVRDRGARVLLWPWGALLARLAVGSDRCFEPTNAAQGRHWTTCYPTRALIPMMALTEHVRAMDLTRVRTETLFVYSPLDEVVDPDRALSVLAGLGEGPPETLVVQDPGDPSSHVLAGDILSPDTTGEVERAILRFLQSRPGSELPVRRH